MYGNRNFDEANTTTLPKNCGTPPNQIVCPADVPIVNPTINTSNNRLSSTGWQYDAAGNTTNDPEGRKFIYDAENKQTEVRDQYNTVIGQYYFDGDGRRVKKIVPSTGETTVFVYDAGAKLVAEYSTVVQPMSDAKVQYLTNDNLGTPRINTDQLGNIVSRSDYMPYGEEIIALGGRSSTDKYVADDVRQGFTGYERDNETDLNCAQNRYHSGNLGRFTSPDPYKIVAEVQAEPDLDRADAKLKAYLSKPQQWNRYVYVVNNPLRFVDPTGEVIVLTGTDAEVQAKLKRLNDFLGDERFNLIKKSSDGRILYLDDKDICGGNFSKFANVGDNEQTKDFSRKFAEILAAPDQVRFNIGVETMFKPQSGDVSRRGLATMLDFRQRGGGVTLSAQESMSGFIEVWVAPNAAQAGNSLAATRDTSSLTEDGSQLRFPDNTVVDAHEFGHVYDLINGLPDGTNSVPFENAARANRPGNQRRKSEH